MDSVKLLSSPLEASGWMWGNLWSSDTPQAMVSMLDVIKLGNGDIVGWLFTASDGTVKRKSLPKWTPKHVEARCRNHDGNLRGYILSSKGEWSMFTNPHDFRTPVTAAYILPSSQLQESFRFVEQVFEKQQGIAVPKMYTYRLVASDVKGKCFVEPEGVPVIPSNRISSKNQKLNEAVKDNLNRIISILEQRSRFQILKINCVFVVEDANDGTLNIRLHHCKEVMINSSPPRRMKRTAKKVYSDTHSVISEITNVSRGSYRTSKCSGDFCSFSEVDESSLAEMEEELNFKFDVEAAKARRRHRNVDGLIEAEVCDEVESNVKFQRDLIESAIANNSLTDLTATTQSYKVPQKSVLLARSEMKLLDKTDSFNANIAAWSKTLQAWYRRTGRALIGPRITSIPASSGHHIEHAMLQIAEHGSVVDESFLKDATPCGESISQVPKLTKEALESVNKHTTGCTPPRAVKVQYDLNLNPFHSGQSSSAKHLGRYYSNTSVCEKCFHVYKDLDRLRQHGFKQDLQDKKQVAKKAKEGMQSYEDIEKVNRFTNQTLHNMRLAEAKIRLDSGKQPPSSCGQQHIFLSKAGAPKGILPPLPWQLSRADAAAEYQQQGGSTFVRNIGAKARHMSEMAEQYSVYTEQDLGGGDVLSPSYDWRQNLAGQSQGMVKSASAGDKVRRPANHVTRDTRGFNSDRLLHPHQRYLASMRREQSSHQTSSVGVRVKGGAKRKMLSKSKKAPIGLLPPLASFGGGVEAASFGAPSKGERPTSPITYSYVQNKLNYYPPSTLQSLKSASKSVSFSSNNSVRSIPHRNENDNKAFVEDESDADDNDDDEIGALAI